MGVNVESVGSIINYNRRSSIAQKRLLIRNQWPTNVDRASCFLRENVLDFVWKFFEGSCDSIASLCCP